jgi:hypothetical protein
MMVGSHRSPTALEVDIKTFPSPFTTARIGDYIEERVFENQGSKCQNRVFGFSGGTHQDYIYTSTGTGLGTGTGGLGTGGLCSNVTGTH